MAYYYNKSLKSIGLNSTPFINPENKSVFAQYTIRIKKRSDFQEKLKAFGIPTSIHYPTILPLQPALKTMDNPAEIKSEYKNAYYASQKVVSLPFHPWMKFNEIDYIVSKIKEANVI